MLKCILPILDTKTGEVKDLELEEKRPPKPREKDFIVTCQNEIKLLVDSRLPGAELRALLALMSHCSWANQVCITRTELANLLGVTTENLWSSLEKLKREKFLWYSKDDRSRFYLDPMICWRGKPHERVGAKTAFWDLFSDRAG